MSELYFVTLVAPKTNTPVFKTAISTSSELTMQDVRDRYPDVFQEPGRYTLSRVIDGFDHQVQRKK